MNREQTLKSKWYWVSRIQMDFQELFEKYLAEKGIDQKKLAKELNISDSYVSMILNGNIDRRISTLTELSMGIGYVPIVVFVKQEDMMVKVDGQTKTDFSFKTTKDTYRENKSANITMEQTLSLTNYSEVHDKIYIVRIRDKNNDNISEYPNFIFEKELAS